ncbi:MAG: hypothetical protein FVQ83_05115 [Chloroflexi bacterium]|nr:hypothetical protein [Chloroflexota bacterium]
MSETPSNQEGGLWVGLLVIAMGGFIILVSADIIPSDDSSFNAPRWISCMAGVAFFSAGVILLLRDYRFAFFRDTLIFRLLQFIVIGALLTAFGIIPTWIAFGPGEREFSGGISIPFISGTTNQGEVSGRVVFGCGAIIIDAIALGYWITGLRRLIIKQDIE